MRSPDSLPLTDVLEAWVAEVERRFAAWRRNVRKAMPAARAVEQPRETAGWRNAFSIQRPWRRRAAARETFHRVQEFVRKRLPKRGTVSVAQAGKELDLGRRTVTAAFRRLGEEKDCVLVSADDIGTVMSRR
jgi:hypothetical protein